MRYFTMAKTYGLYVCWPDGREQHAYSDFMRNEWHSGVPFLKPYGLLNEGAVEIKRCQANQWLKKHGLKLELPV